MMKLKPAAIEHIIQTETRFNRFDEHFKLFLKQLTYFSEPTCPIKGIVIEQAADARSITMEYRTITITLRLLFQLNTQNSPSARVEGLLERPRDSKIPEKLGTFTFNPLGITDFEPDSDGDPVNLEGKALEIAVHFLALALRHGAA